MTTDKQEEAKKAWEDKDHSYSVMKYGDKHPDCMRDRFISRKDFKSRLLEEIKVAMKNNLKFASESTLNESQAQVLESDMHCYHWFKELILTIKP